MRSPRRVRRRDALAEALRALPWPGLRIAPSAANFLFIDLARPNGPVNEALLARGIIVKPWKEPGFETFIRVSIGTPDENARFLARPGRDRRLAAVTRPAAAAGAAALPTIGA